MRPFYRQTWFVLVSLLLGSVGLSTWIEPWFQSWAGSRTESGNLLAVALGDSRRLFANHVYAKADAYFHNGYYPSIFDQANQPDPSQGSVLGSQAGLQDGSAPHQCRTLNEALDWLDRFGRHFYPSTHAHLGDDACNDPDHDHDHGHDEDHQEGAPGQGRQLEREILPWLRLSAGLDPNRVETYVVAAYWLRMELGQTTEAEQFLREGLRHNPRNPEILFELGRIYFEDRKDFVRARNVWELGLTSLKQRSDAEPSDNNRFLMAQFLGNLSRLEEGEGRWAATLAHLRELVLISPHRDFIEQWIAEVEAKQAASPSP